jgi:hypothetical protein
MSIHISNSVLQAIQVCYVVVLTSSKALNDLCQWQTHCMLYLMPSYSKHEMIIVSD